MIPPYSLSRSLLGATLATALLATSFGLQGCRRRDPQDHGSTVRPKTGKRYTIQQFMKTKSIGGGGISFDDSRVLFASDETGILNAYTIPVTGGVPTALTRSTKESIVPHSFFPRDARILYRSDQGGNEIQHIYLRNEDGRVRDLTPWPGALSHMGGWAYDDDSFFFISNRRTKKFFDLYEMDLTTFRPRLIYRNEKGFNMGLVSRDERWLALTKTRTTNDNDLYLHDRKKGSTQHLSPHEGEAKFSPCAFGPESAWLYYTTNVRGEFRVLMRYHLATGRRETVERARWDIYSTSFSRSGRYRVTYIDDDGRIRIRIDDRRRGRPLKLPRLPAGQISSVSFSRSEKRMTFTINGCRRPNTLYVMDLETGRHQKLVEALNPAIDPAHLVDGRIVRYRSFDGRRIPAILYVPHGATRRARVPAVLWIHGGPGGQSRIRYAPMLQYLVNHGYAVLAVNNRGSSGYGKTFKSLDDRKHGDADLADCVAAVPFLASLGVVDAERVAIMGGSYGGYMTLAALAFRPRAFAAGVDIYGVSNWLRTLRSIPVWWEAQRKSLYVEMGDPEKDEAYLRKISPLFHAHRIERPLMVVQGANDPRVLKAESDEIVAAVRKKGVPVEYLVFDDEGHGFRKKKNQIRANEAILAFLDRHLVRRQKNEK